MQNQCTCHYCGQSYDASDFSEVAAHQHQEETMVAEYEYADDESYFEEVIIN